MGVFCYSDVENTRSFDLDDKLDEETIPERRNRLMAVQKKISARKLRSGLGKRFSALLEGPSKENELVGRRGSRAWLRKSTANSTSPTSRCRHRELLRSRGTSSRSRLIKPTLTTWWDAWSKCWIRAARQRLTAWAADWPQPQPRIRCDASQPGRRCASWAKLPARSEQRPLQASSRIVAQGN